MNRKCWHSFSHLKSELSLLHCLSTPCAFFVSSTNRVKEMWFALSQAAYRSFLWTVPFIFGPFFSWPVFGDSDEGYHIKKQNPAKKLISLEGWKRKKKNKIKFKLEMTSSHANYLSNFLSAVNHIMDSIRRIQFQNKISLIQIVETIRFYK